MKLLSTLDPKAEKLWFMWIIMFWTIVLLYSLIWNILGNQHTATDIALAYARESFQKDLLARRWNASHGGVYVFVTEKTQPNPYLSSTLERDITTPSGRNLTMINPAYMTRQLHELALVTDGAAGHITSLKPIRPENKPDDWEAEALRSFENGKTEVYTIFEREGENYLRLMLPLHTEKNCLKCHAQQGYSEGMVRGGISVIVPVPSWDKIALLSGHFLLWVMGLLAITFLGLRVNTAIHKRQQAEKDLAEGYRDLEIRIVERTVEYEEANEQLQDEIVERSKVQEKLEYSVKHWRETFDVMSDFVSVHDNNFKLVKVNKSLADFFGKKPKELIGKYCYELMHNTPEPWPDCPHLKAIEKQEMITEEIEEPHLEKTLLVTCSPFFDEKGMALGTVHVARDITEQKHSKNLLKEREKQYRAVFENTGTATFVVEEDMTISQANAKCEEISGYRRDEIIGKMKATDFIPIEELARINKIHSERMENSTDVPSEYELKFIDRNGEIKDVFIQVALIPQTKQSIASIIDISPLKKTEKELKESEKKYRTLFNSSTDAISIIDLDAGRFVDCNDAAVKLHDTSTREKLIGLRPDQLSPEFQPTGELSHKLSIDNIKVAFKEGGKEFEWIHCKKDGTPFPVMVTLSPMVLGKRKFILAFGKDITDRKQDEKEREKLIKELKNALEKVKTLSGLVPICANCKKIRDDKGFWNQIEGYIQKYSEVKFSHGMCPECLDEVYGNEDWYIKEK